MASKTRIEKLEQAIKPISEPGQVIRIPDNLSDQDWAELEAAGEVINIRVEPDPAIAHLFKGKKR